MRCKNCHYSLEGLDAIEALMDDEHRCPECGTPFDPLDPKTYDLTTEDQQRARLAEILVYLGIASVLVCLWLILTRNIHP